MLWASEGGVARTAQGRPAGDKLAHQRPERTMEAIVPRGSTPACASSRHGFSGNLWRGRRRGPSFPNRGQVFEISVSVFRTGGMASRKAAGQGCREEGPAKQGAQISNTWAGFRSERGSRRPHCPVTSRFRFAEKVCLPQAVRKTRAGVDRCSDTLRHHG